MVKRKWSEKVEEKEVGKHSRSDGITTHIAMVSRTSDDGRKVSSVNLSGNVKI